MENLTYENIMIAGTAMAKIAYNFWPCVVLFAGFCVYETWFTNPRYKRVRNETR